jgi:hypothetical protein
MITQKQKPILLKVLIYIHQNFDKSKSDEYIDTIGKKICFDMALNDEERIYIVSNISKMINDKIVTETDIKRLFGELIIALLNDNEIEVMKNLKNCNQ